MQLFIQKILMNSLNVEGFVTDLFDSLDNQYTILEYGIPKLLFQKERILLISELEVLV